MNQIELYENEIRLNSHLTEYAFGKTNYDSILAQKGVLWNGEDFEPWSFSDVQSFSVEGEDERFVFYCGKNPLGKNAKTLSGIFEQNDEESFLAAKTVCNIITVAAKNEVSLPIIGAGGIILENVKSKKNENKKTKVLFLPQDLFRASSNGLSKTEQFFAWNSILNETLHDLPAMCFLRSCIAYRAVTGFFPFRAEDVQERNADILDRNFMPLEFCIEGVSSELAVAVNRGLKLNSNEVLIPGKKKKGKSNEDLTPQKEFPLELLDDAWELAKKQKSEKNEEFEQKAQNYMKSRTARINTKRKIRRNSFAITATLIAVAVVIIISISTAKTRRDEYTSKGLTSEQTIRAFFYAVNTKSTILVGNLTKGRKTRDYADTVSQIYVLSKQRQTYSRDNGFATPENWLIYSTTPERYAKSGIYGITQLRIDGSKNVSELDVKMQKIKDNPEPITSENGINVEKGSVSVHTADYYLLHSEGEDLAFIVEKIHETFTLTFINDKWLITDIETQSTTLNVNCEKFQSDYFAALAEHNGNQIDAVESLKNLYEWLPTKYAMQSENDRLIWEASHPMEALGF